MTIFLAREKPSLFRGLESAAGAPRGNYEPVATKQVMSAKLSRD
jgi:hypothetical protein